MFIRSLFPYILFSCFIIPYVCAKSFSLNEAIAAEERQRHKLEPISTSPESEEKFRINKVGKTSFFKPEKLLPKELVFPRGEKTFSILNLRNKFQIKTPLKPNELKSNLQVRNKRKNKSLKRHVLYSGNEKIKRKYIPLYRSLSILFDNILTDDSSDGIKDRRQKLRKYRNTSRKSNPKCTCSKNSDRDGEQSTEETAAFTQAVVQISSSTQAITTEATTPTTHLTSTSDISSLRTDSFVPLLPTRDSTSSRRDDIRFSEGSGPTFHASDKGNITGDHRDSEHNTGRGKNRTHAENNEKNTDSNSRNRPGSDRFGGRLQRNYIPSPVYRGGIDETQYSNEDESNRYIRKNFNDFERQNRFEIGGNKIESSEFLQQPVRGGRFVPSNNVINSKKSLQPKEGYEKGINSVTVNIPNDQQLTIGNGSATAKAQETSRKSSEVKSIVDFTQPITMLQNSTKYNQQLTIGNGSATSKAQETSASSSEIKSIVDFTQPITLLQNSTKYKAPFVTIIDGYSVARDKNGANKLAEQSIRIHS